MNTKLQTLIPDYTAPDTIGGFSPFGKTVDPPVDTRVEQVSTPPAPQGPTNSGVPDIIVPGLKKLLPTGGVDPTSLEPNDTHAGIPLDIHPLELHDPVLPVTPVDPVTPPTKGTPTDPGTTDPINRLIDVVGQQFAGGSGNAGGTPDTIALPLSGTATASSGSSKGLVIAVIVLALAGLAYYLHKRKGGAA